MGLGACEVAPEVLAVTEALVVGPLLLTCSTVVEFFSKAYVAGMDGFDVIAL